MECLLGIDVGTSGTKVALFTLNGRLLASVTEEYPLYQPKPGWAEQDPADWWRATCTGIRRALTVSGVDVVAIRGIGLSGQMHGAVLLDERGEVIRPAIIWCDQRSVEQAESISALISPSRVCELTSNLALPNFTATKVLWVREQEPANYQKIHKILLPKDYIRYKLTGEFVTEVSDASGTLLFDVAHRRWSSEMLECLAIQQNWLPECTESAVISGQVSRQAAEETGLAYRTPVAGGAGDQAAGAVGNGIIQQGLVSATIGTSGVVFAATESMVLDQRGRLHSFCHAVDGLWHVMGVTQAAGGSLQWYRNTLASEMREVARLVGRDPYELITAAAAQVVAGSEGLVFLPYLMGERTPHLNPYARGAFFGLSPRHDKRHLARAVMEGVTFSLRDCLELITEFGVEFTEVRVSGGGARSPMWRQMLADIFKRPVVNVIGSEGPALGAALLAGAGTGVYTSLNEACEQTIKVSEALLPETQVAQFYERQYRLFRRLYTSLEERFFELKELY